MFKWNISQPANALSTRQTVSQNPREFFSQAGLFLSFPMFSCTRQVAAEHDVDGC